MFNWFCNLFASAAYDIAVISSGFASGSGMHQMKEPEALIKLAQEKAEDR